MKCEDDDNGSASGSGRGFYVPGPSSGRVVAVVLLSQQKFDQIG